MKRFILLVIFDFALLIATGNATIHYVKHGQGNVPPYLTWQTAADSIMWAVNVSQFGDTIYVANGVYKERVYMIPGLSLIGEGMDSCVIDTRDLSGPWPFFAVEIKDSCLLKGFKIIVTSYPDSGQTGIWDSGTSGSTVILNRITTSAIGIEIDNVDTSNVCNLFIYNNIIDNICIGAYIFNSNTIIRNNSFYPSAYNPLGVWNEGIIVGAYFFNNHPLIDSNYIYIANGEGIRTNFGSIPKIKNNTIIVDNFSDGITLGISPDSCYVYNNLIIAKDAFYGILSATHYSMLYNNYIIGNVHGSGQAAIEIDNDYEVKNNVVTGAATGILALGTNGLVFQYNNVWNNGVNYSGFIPDSTNISVDPMIMNDDSTQGQLDFHLQKYSPLIDAGDPSIFDKDSSRSDIGLYGGPYGESYIYQDIAPRPPVNFSAVVDSNGVFLNWNRNTEADTAYYSVYRDTVKNFTIDSTKKIISTADTFYTDVIPQGAELMAYKVTAVDKQGNESRPSEEKDIVLTGIKGKPVVINNYILYQNYPNPFNPTTKIGYRLKENGYVKLYVYDIKGALVETLVNEHQIAGYHEVEFSGEGKPEMITVKNPFASGIYIYQIMVKNDKGIPAFSDVKKMILLK